MIVAKAVKGLLHEVKNHSSSRKSDRQRDVCRLFLLPDHHQQQRQRAVREMGVRDEDDGLNHRESEAVKEEASKRAYPSSSKAYDRNRTVYKQRRQQRQHSGNTDNKHSKCISTDRQTRHMTDANERAHSFIGSSNCCCTHACEALLAFSF